MNPTEKQMRYQSLAKLGRMERSGAKPSTIETMRRALAGTEKAGQKGKVFTGRAPRPRQ